MNALCELEAIGIKWMCVNCAFSTALKTNYGVLQ